MADPKRIMFWAADMAGSGWYRMGLPAQGLAWLGHEVLAATSLPSTLQRRPSEGGAQVVVGSRVALPAATTLWRRMGEQGKRLVLDLDDDYWRIDTANVAAYNEWNADRGAMLRRLSANMAHSAAVTVCSEGLARVAREHTDAPVIVVPNALPAQWMSHVRDYRPNVLRVGWAGTASTVHDLHIAARALRKVADLPGVEVRLIGVPPEAAHRAGARHGRIKTFGWVQQKDYLSLANTFDVWVAPYRDVAFNRAKFPTKALEAGMLGVPLIASAIEPYAEWITHDETGLLVEREHEWTRLLRRLVEDAELRERLGKAARGRAASNILQTVNQQWEAVCLDPTLEPR